MDVIEREAGMAAVQAIRQRPPEPGEWRSDYRIAIDDATTALRHIPAASVDALVKAARDGAKALRKANSLLSCYRDVCMEAVDATVAIERALTALDEGGQG